MVITKVPLGLFDLDILYLCSLSGNYPVKIKFLD